MARRTGLLLLLLPTLARAQWMTRAPLPSPHQEVGVTEAGGHVYVVGGIDDAGQMFNRFVRYDPALDSWESLPALPAPQPLHHVATASVDGMVFAIGGLRQDFSPVNLVYRFDPVTGAWTQRASMPTFRGAVAVAVIDGKIYAAGGYPAARGSDFAAYDPAANAWTALPLMPTARDHHVAAAVGGKFYSIAGRSGGLLHGAVEVFDPATGQWTQRATIPTPRAGCAGAVVDGHVFVFGGEGNAASPDGIFDDVEAFVPETNTWSVLDPMPVPRHGTGAAAVGRTIFLPGGATVQGFAATAHHDSVTPCSTTIELRVEKTLLSWSAISSAASYDVVRGSLANLIASGGDYTAAIEECLVDNHPDMSLPYMTPPPAGDAFWLLVRGAQCGGPGSYDSSASSQQGARDAEINASPVSCAP